MSTPDVTVIEGFPVTAAPVEYVLSGAQVLQVRAAFAKFDGTGAAGPFLASIGFYAQDGKLFSRAYPTTPVAQGDTAEVSFAPFPGGLISTGGEGLQFEGLNPVYGPSNVGAALSVQTTGTHPATGVGTQLSDTGGAGINLVTTGGGVVEANSDGGFQVGDNSNNGVGIIENGGGGVQVTDNGGGNITILESGNDAFITLNNTGSGTGGILVENAAGGGGIAIHNQDTGGSLTTITNEGTGVLALFQRGTGELVLDTQQGAGSALINIQAGTGGVLINSAAGGDVDVGGDVLFLTGNLAPVAPTTITVEVGIKTNAAFIVHNDSSGAVPFQVNADGHVYMPHLPTSAAGLTAGALWNNAGVVNIV